jgi:omega-amidase
MKIGLVQMDIVWESKKDNVRRAEQYVEQAARNGCDILVFPEMFNTGFSMNVAVTCEPSNGETSEALSRMAGRYGVNLIAGYAVNGKNKGKGRNQSAVFDRAGKQVGTFVKRHSFAFADEDRFYDAGETSMTFEVEGMPSSLFICFDLRFPEVFREVAGRVKTIFVLANWPSKRVEHWEVLLRARAIENQAFVIGVNRTGTDGNGIDYPGKSKVFGPMGNEICSGSAKEELVIGEIVPEEVDEVRKTFPFLVIGKT